MINDDRTQIKKTLLQIPDGTLHVERYSSDLDGMHLPAEHLYGQIDGKGLIEAYQPFPGIEVAINTIQAGQAAFHHEALSSVLEVNYCRAGRVGWNMKGNVAVYLGAGDLAIHSMDCCADSDMILPVGYYEGISVSINLSTMAQTQPDILTIAGFNAQHIYNKFCTAQKPIAIPSSEEIEHIFAPLYHLPEPQRKPYFQLKTQELLLFLNRLDLNAVLELTQYSSGQTELIKEIHTLLTQHLDQRYTIEELSKKYLLNSSSLKKIFKAVYGQPIASYMKKYRVQKARKLLRETDQSIADIAAQLGYETQGKFTNAFKDVAFVLPTEYRRQCRK